MRNRQRFVQDMVAFCEMQERLWDAIHFSLVQKSTSVSPCPASAAPAPAAPAAGAPGAGVRAGGFLGAALRRRLVAVAQMVVVLAVAKAPQALWLAAGIFGVLTLLGVPEAMRAAAGQAGRGGGETLEAVLGRLRVREKAKQRLAEYRRRLETGETVEEKETEQVEKDEEFLRRQRNGIADAYKIVYQTLVMFVLTAFPGARFHEELLK